MPKFGGAALDEAVRVTADGLLTTAEMAARSDFALGLAVLSPSTRTMTGPGGKTEVEPRVLQVLLVLADAGGRVVARDTLFRRCWGAVFVGDDSLNRAIAGVRRLASETANGSFQVETIPRVGYRLTGASPSPIVTKSADGADGWRLSRRQLAGGAVGVAALAAFGGWAMRASRENQRFDELMDHGSEPTRTVDFDLRKALPALEEAVQLRPGSARAWGLLAFVRSISLDSLVSGETIEPRPQTAEHRALALASAEDAARKALAIDPREPNALLAMFELQGATLDWTSRDQRLRRIVALDPLNMFALTELISLTQSLGMNRESWDLTERALAIEPLSPDLLCRRALKHWIAGRIADADTVIDQVRDRWPSNPFGWFVQFLILALSGRAHAASAMLDTAPGDLMPPPALALWRDCLPALEHRTAAAIATARQACLAGARLAGELAAYSVMILSALNQVDDAFQVAVGFLLWRGQVVRGGKPPPKQLGRDSGWRANTQWLFTPPCAAMRADPRFHDISDGIGLTEYWRRRGVKPDFMLTERRHAANLEDSSVGR